MDNDTLFKVLAVVSPFISGGVTYLLTQRAKKSEYLYQNRIPAFKEVLPVLIKIKKYAMGKIALNRGAEFSPYFDEEGSALMLRTELANISDANEVFLTKKSKHLISNIDGQLGIFCNAELNFPNVINQPENPDAGIIDYTPLFDVTEKCIAGLYKEVGLPDK